MKMFAAFAIFFWLACGLVGAWWLEGLGDMRFKTIARGPISLVKAINERPVSYPGPN